MHPFGFNALKHRLANIADGIERGLFFHRGRTHVFSFDRRKLQHGSTCGSNCDEDRNSKIADSQLTLLSNANKFEDHAHDVADAICEQNQWPVICLFYYEKYLCS